MDTHRDTLVGLFILGSIGIILGLLVVTSDALDDRAEIYMRAATANGLTNDTRVFLQGLQVGRVMQVNARVEREGLSFVARLSLQATFPDGTPLQVPVGTRGVIAEPSPISASVVRLEFPANSNAPPSFLQPGDTIESARVPGAFDILGGVASELKEEVLQTLVQTRALIDESTRAIAQSQRMIISTQGVIDSTTPKIDEALVLLATSLERTNELLAEVTPRIGPLQDSLTATLAQARRILGSFDTLATSAHAILNDNRNVVREALDRITSTTRLLNHFAEQVTRRPTRLLTGVKPPPPDSSGGAR